MHTGLNAKSLNDLNDDVNVAIRDGVFAAGGGSVNPTFCQSLENGDEAAARGNDAKDEWDRVVALSIANVAVAVVAQILGFIANAFEDDSKIKKVLSIMESVFKFVAVILLFAAGFITLTGDAESFTEELDNSDCYTGSKTIKTFGSAAGKLKEIAQTSILAAGIQFMEMLASLANRYLTKSE
jgi:hypothetical protein